MSHAIVISGLQFSYGSHQVLHGIDLAVPRGAIYGLLGPNGAGKTTLIRLLLGLLRPAAGTILVDGRAPAFGRRGPEGVGAMIESPSLYPNLSAAENLAVTAHSCGFDHGRIPGLLDTVGLATAGSRPVAKFSLGMKQRLAIALALVGDPRMLILDEPVNGLDPEGIDEIRRLLARLRDESGLTILLSTHILSDVERLATHVGIVRAGRLAFGGEMRAIRNAHLEIDCDDVAGAAQVLARMGVRHAALDGGLLAAYDVADGIEINRQLVTAGIGVGGLRRSATALEDFYHDATP